MSPQVEGSKRERCGVCPGCRANGLSPCWEVVGDSPTAPPPRPGDIPAPDVSGLVSDAEYIAREFHDSYELYAPAHGYKTREASRVPWDEVPTKNRHLMVNVVQALLDRGVIARG